MSYSSTVMTPDPSRPSQKYDPAYDIVNNAPFFLARTTRGLLSRSNRPAWVADLAAVLGLDDQALADACRALNAGLADFATDQEVTDPAELGSKLEASGFLTLPVTTQALVLGYLGQVVLCAMAFGIKDRAVLGEQAGQCVTLRKLADEAERIAASLRAVAASMQAEGA